MSAGLAAVELSEAKLWYHQAIMEGAGCHVYLACIYADLG